MEGEGTREVEDSEVGEAEVFYIMQSDVSILGYMLRVKMNLWNKFVKRL